MGFGADANSLGGGQICQLTPPFSRTVGCDSPTDNSQPDTLAIVLSYINFNDEIYYTRKWCEKIVGKQTTDAIFEFSEKFNQLELFDSEKAILFPLIITNYGNNFNFIKYFFFFNY